MLEEIQEETEVTTPDKIIKKWRSKVENKNLDPADCFDYFQLSAPYFLSFSSKDKGNDCGELYSKYILSRKKIFDQDKDFYQQRK